jgi:hypothetical protein
MQAAISTDKGRTYLVGVLDLDDDRHDVPQDVGEGVALEGVHGPDELLDGGMDD